MIFYCDVTSRRMTCISDTTVIWWEVWLLFGGKVFFYIDMTEEWYDMTHYYSDIVHYYSMTVTWREISMMKRRAILYWEKICVLGK